MCPLCNAIEQRKSGTPGHPKLYQEGNPKRGRSPSGEAITTTHYRCKVCGTKWTYENDKKNDRAGWSASEPVR